MFSRKDQLLKKTGPDGIGRYDFLRLLKKEFCETNSEDGVNNLDIFLDAKIQILVNLANFAYDPINYDYLRSLDIIYLFLNELKTGEDCFINCAAAAICNLSSDPLNCEYIFRQNGIEIISNSLKHSNEDRTLNIIASLIFLKINLSLKNISCNFHSNLIEIIENLKSESSVRIRNLAKVFLEQQDVAPGTARLQGT